MTHFAGFKAVGKSVEKPIYYWGMNVNGSRHLLDAMQSHRCHTPFFRSSATLYDNPELVPIPETAPISPINPNDHTKVLMERLLSILHASTPNSWRIAFLRCRNPFGGHRHRRASHHPDDGSRRRAPCRP